MMIQRIKHAVIALLLTLNMGLVLTPAVASADFTGDACKGVQAVGGTCGQGSAKRLSNIVQVVINVLSFVVGFTAVLMIVIGGFKYITAAGDSNNLASAKNTIIYAIVGLVIVASAQVIVRFVLVKVT